MKKIYRLMVGVALLSTNPLFAMHDESEQRNDVVKHRKLLECDADWCIENLGPRAIYDAYLDWSQGLSFTKTLMKEQEEVFYNPIPADWNNKKIQQEMLDLDIRNRRDLERFYKKTARGNIGIYENNAAVQKAAIQKLEDYITSASAEDRFTWAVIQYDKHGNWARDSFFGTSFSERDPTY